MDNILSCSNNHILVGLGGTGGKILRAFKMSICKLFYINYLCVKR